MVLYMALMLQAGKDISKIILLLWQKNQTTENMVAEYIPMVLFRALFTIMTALWKIVIPISI